jgi:OOP family OmpA-OmpF porin
MMNRFFILAAALLFATGSAFAQPSKKGAKPEKEAPVEEASDNLVSNSGFEDLDLKPLKTYGQLVELCTGWLSPNASSADLFATGVKGTKAGAPINDFGVQEPMGGSAYAGFTAYTKDPKRTRTYIQGKLTSKLTKDQLYCVKFNVSLADLSKYGVNNVGVFLSDRKVQNNNDNALSFQPQVMEKTNKPLQMIDGWETICGAYIAKGTEEYFIIGGFGPEDKMKTVKIKKPSNVTGTVMNSAYYYIDNIEIVPVEANSQCACGGAEDREDDVIYSRAGARAPGMKPEQLINSSGVYFPFLSAEINPMFEEELAEIAAVMKADPAIKVELTGHVETDELNEAKINPRCGNLAQRRAEAVRQYFMDKGISEVRFTIVIKDDTMPANTTGTVIGRSQNRRVMFKKI